MTEVNTIQISTKQETFKFINELDSNDKSYYDIIINVDTVIYSNGKVYYIINYLFEFHGDEQSRNKLHPFYGENTSQIELEDGVIIYKNAMTEIMVTYLLDSNEKLAKVSGASTPQCYRSLIMLNLSKLWD